MVAEVEKDTQQGRERRALRPSLSGTVIGLSGSRPVTPPHAADVLHCQRSVAHPDIHLGQFDPRYPSRVEPGDFVRLSSKSAL
jgi:hypothetical protein